MIGALTLPPKSSGALGTSITGTAPRAKRGVIGNHITGIREHTMPWHISNNAPGCDGFAVVKDATGEIEGCHPTQGDALAQLAALHIAEADQ